MAKKAKDAAKPDSVNPDDLLQFVREATKAQQSASEHVSSAGGLIKGWIERLKLNAKAVKQVIKLHGMEVNKRNAHYRDLLEYGLLMGHFDQMDMFDDTVKVIDSIRSRITGSEIAQKQKEPDPAVTQFN